jgi:hypothetical protein
MCFLAADLGTGMFWAAGRTDIGSVVLHKEGKNQLAYLSLLVEMCFSFFFLMKWRTETHVHFCFSYIDNRTKRAYTRRESFIICTRPGCCHVEKAQKVSSSSRRTSGRGFNVEKKKGHGKD